MTLDLHAELLTSLRASPTVARALLADMTNASLRRRPAATEWAAIEIVAHLADNDERVRERLNRILTEDEPTLAAFDPATLARERRYIEFDPARELDRYERSRQAHVALLEHLNEAEWRRRGRHDEHGFMSIELYEAHIACHDVDHLAQLALTLRAARAGADVGARA